MNYSPCDCLKYGEEWIYSFTHLLDTTAQIQQMCPFGDRDTRERQTHSCESQGATKCMRKTQSSYLLHYIFGNAINNHRPLSASSSFSFSTSVWELMNNRNTIKIIFKTIFLKLVRTINLKIDAGSCWPLSPSPASCTSLAVCMPLQAFYSIVRWK